MTARGELAMIKVCEIFAGIQGESTLQGLPTVFVRLTGCNLNCRFCDTPYAREDGIELTVEEVISRIKKFYLTYVCVTGGEPLLQKETLTLADKLVNQGLTVSVETNGTFDVSVLNVKVIRVIDIKCPGSGEHGKTHPANIAHPGQNTEYKFVVGGREDFEYARDFVRNHGLGAARALLLSPVTGELEPKQLAEWIIAEMPESRLQIQLHKVIWPDEIRGR